jgi:hypothetical protein
VPVCGQFNVYVVVVLTVTVVLPDAAPPVEKFVPVADVLPGQFQVIVVVPPLPTVGGFTVMVGGCWDGGQLEFEGGVAGQEPLHAAIPLLV